MEACQSIASVLQVFSKCEIGNLNLKNKKMKLKTKKIKITKQKMQINIIHEIFHETFETKPTFCSASTRSFN